MSKIVNDIDAQGFTIKNIPTPVDPLDVVNKDYVDSLGGAFYRHEQNIPNSTWTVVHNLGYSPNVRIKNSAGDFMQAVIRDIDNNSLFIIFDADNAGEAYCS